MGGGIWWLVGWRLSSGLVICRCDAAGGLGDNQPGASKNPPALSLERLLNKGHHSSNGDNSDDFSFGAAFLTLGSARAAQAWWWLCCFVVYTQCSTLQLVLGKAR